MDSHTKRPVGRPSSITPEKLEQLDRAFSMGLNDSEALLMCDLTPSRFYEWLEKHPEYREKKEILKRKPLMKAKMNIAEYLQKKDKDITKWYAERKGDDEFSNKTKLEHSGGVNVTIRRSS